MASKRSRRHLRVEPLESRDVPASFLVTTTADLAGPSGTTAVSLRDAIRQSNNTPNEDNLITVPAGTYTLTRTGRGEDAALTGDLDVLPTGGYTVQIFGAGADQTIIDAAGIDRIFDVLPGARLLIFDATLRGGSTENGGAVQNRGQLAIHNSIVTGNTGTMRGGAVDINSSSATFASQDTLFENNVSGTSPTAGGLGGAISNAGGQMQINDGTFRNNRTGSLGSGGAIYSRSGSNAVLTSTFDSNRAGMGGAVATDGGNSYFIESTFTANRAEYSGAGAAAMGGAIYGKGETYVTRSTLTQNEVIGGGRGGALANSAYMEVVDSTISGNKAGATGQYGAGAGIYNAGGFNLIQSTVTKNATLGGGFGDGVFNNTSGANFMVLNTIVAQNGAIPGNNGPDTYGYFTSRGGNVIGLKAGSNGWVSTDQVGLTTPINPRLGPLQNNGGPTATHALRLGSPAIDRGVNDLYVNNAGGVDQRNLARVVNNVPDAGAYELQPRTNDAPVGAADAYSVSEDGILTVSAANGILANDTDPDGDILDAAIVSWPSWATQFTIFSDGAFNYKPLANWHGTDTFTYRATDGALQSDPIVVTITVNPVNDAPTAKNDSYTVNEDNTLTVPAAGILGNDTDIDGDALTAQIVTGPAHGTLTPNADGSFVYTPDANWNGKDSFTYKAFDGAALSAAATVSITVQPVNDAPVATQDLIFFTNEEQAVSGQVTATDVDGNALTFSVASGPTWGTLSLAADGTFTYTPYTNFASLDTFVFSVTDGLASDTAVVRIQVSPVNDAPEAFNVTLTMDEDSQLNDRYFSWRDVDGDNVTFRVLDNTNPGVFQYSASEGRFSYSPPVNFNGTVDYQYVANDGRLDSNVARVRFIVRPVNDAPVAVPDSKTLDEDAVLDASAGGSDVDGDAITFAAVDQPAHGTLNFNSDGTYTYAPDANYHGADSFTFRVNDGTADSNLARIDLTIAPVNDAPTADSGSLSLDEDTPRNGAVTGSDIDGDALAFAVVDQPTRGTLSFKNDGTFTYTPNANENGTDFFTFRANDGIASSKLARIDITIAPVNDAPIANAGTDFAINESATAAFDGRDSSDVDGDALTYSWNFGDGTSGSGATPTHAYPESGAYTVTLTVSDGIVSRSDSLVLTVRNTAPTANASGPAVAVPGQSVSFTFSATDPSPGDTAAGFKYVIAWGDGQSETVNGPASGITLGHVYASTGVRTVSATATDRDAGTSGAASRTIAVQAANLQGGTLFVGGTIGGDVIDIRPSDATGGLAVTVNGSPAGPFAPTGDIVVFGQAGADTITVATAKIGKSTVSVTRPVFLFGGDGNDTLSATGASAGTVIVGGAGNDSITGGTGRDVLIGGTGADTVRGGDGEDILIGGFTDFDGDLAALRAVRAEWVRTDAAFSTRVARLRGTGGGLNQGYFLVAATVDDDAASDTLYGEGGTDWFFARKVAVADNLADDKNSEEFTWI